MLLSATALVIGTHSAPASPEVPTTRFVCATPHLTTSYVLLEYQESYELQVVHHHGIEFMPIHEGLITIRDLQTLSKLAETLKKMGERVTLSLKKSQCSRSEEEWTCLKQTPTMVGSLRVDGFRFKLTQERLITRLTDMKTHKVDFSITLDKSGYSLPMEYAETDCRFH